MHTYLRQSRLGIVRIFSLSILTGVLGGKLSDWAVDALEGLRLMYPGHVSHKSPSVMEGLSTLVTQHLRIWVLVVLSNVHFQVGHSSKALSTLKRKH